MTLERIVSWAQLAFAGIGIAAMLYMLVSSWLRDRVLIAGMRQNAKQSAEFHVAMLEAAAKPPPPVACPDCGKMMIPVLSPMFPTRRSDA